MVVSVCGQKELEQTAIVPSQTGVKTPAEDVKDPSLEILPQTIHHHNPSVIHQAEQALQGSDGGEDISCHVVLPSINNCPQPSFQIPSVCLNVLIIKNHRHCRWSWVACMATQIAGRQNSVSVQLAITAAPAVIPACFLPHCTGSHVALARLVLSWSLALQPRIRLCEAIVSKQTSSLFGTSTSFIPQPPTLSSYTI